MKKIFTLALATICINFSVYSSSSSANNGIQNRGTERKVSVYPNPAHNNVFISYIGTDLVDEVQIFDALGTNLEALEVEQVNSHLIRIRTSSLIPGVYFIRVTIGTYSQTERVIVG